MRRVLSDFISLIFGEPEGGEMHSWVQVIITLILLMFIVSMVTLTF